MKKTSYTPNDKIDYRKMLEKSGISASAPCRIDMGGTLDIATFHYPLASIAPMTVNIAIDMRTRVDLLPYTKGYVKISSKGFDDAEFPAECLPFDHPMGLMFAVASYFNADGVHIKIDSESPPKSAMGGSSVAASALISAFYKIVEKAGFPYPEKNKIALLAHALEGSVAGVACGIQDQLAAVYGGVNAWKWIADPMRVPFEREILADEEVFEEMEKSLIIAYSGITHVSKDINQRWINGFLSGDERETWIRIAGLSRDFAGFIKKRLFGKAAEILNEETHLRLLLTPDVLDGMGMDLFHAAKGKGCGARFTGAGGGGAVYALGEKEHISALLPVWSLLLSKRETACILPSKIAREGLILK